MHATKVGLTVIFHADGARLEAIECPVPDPDAGEILIRTSFATLCRSDLLTYTAKRREKDPTILGHEFTGRVEKIGGALPLQDLRGRLVKIGDRITSAIFAANPDSEMSRRGIPQKSADLFKYGHEQFTAESGHHGGLSMYILLRRHTPVVVLEEDGLSDPLASILNCAVATAAAALRMSGDLRGRSVLITGAGMLGLVACAMARAQGASLVHATDIAPDRQVRALAFGAHRSWVAEGDWASVLADELDGPHPFDCVFDFTGDPVVIGAGVGLLSIGGTAVWVGSTYPQPSVSISAEQIVRRVLTIRGIHNYNADDLLRAVEFMESFHDKYPFQSLVEGEFSLSEAADAFHFALSRHPYRAGIRF